MRDLLTDFQAGARIDQLTAAGVDLLFVLPVPPASLARFVRESSCPPWVAERLFADPRAALAAAAACNKKFDSRSKFTSPHAQTTVLQATLRGLAIGLRTGPQGDPRQQGGSWVLEGVGGSTAAGGGGTDAGAAAAPPAPSTASPAGWVTTWGKRDRHNADQVPLPLLVHLAGAPPGGYVHPRPAAGAGADGPP